MARSASLYEARKDWAQAAAAYRDIARNSKDRELADAARGRAAQLAGSGGSSNEDAAPPVPKKAATTRKPAKH